MYEDNSGNPLTSGGNPIIGTMFMRTGLWTERIHLEIFELNEGVVLRRCDGDSDASGGRCWISYSLAIGASCEESADNWVRQGIGRLPECTGISETVYFQIGGDVVVPEKTPAGTYEGTLNAMLTCE